MKIIYMGTPEFSAIVLEKLLQEYKVDLVVTQPDKVVGRKKEIKFSKVKDLALKNNIEIFQPINIKEDYNYIVNLKPDLIITCAYGQILPEELLNSSSIATINVHASLLPKLRGGAPIQKALIDDYKKTGITIMYMNKLMDSGDIISSKEVILDDSYNYPKLHDELAKVASILLIDTLPSIINKTNKRIKQDESKVTYAYTIKREDEKIDFNKSVREIFNLIRGLSYNPCAYLTLNNKIIKIYEAIIYSNKKTNDEVASIIGINKEGILVNCIDGVLLIKKLKPEGKNIMDAYSYGNGKKDLIGMVFNK